MMTSISVKTHRRCDMVDITADITRIIRESEVESGIVIVHVPHTTAAVTINENADPDVVHDILMTLDEILPQMRKGYRHCEGNSDAHIKSSLFGPSLTVVIEGGEPVLGTWQGIYFCEFDGPRNRKCIVKVMSDS